MGRVLGEEQHRRAVVISKTVIGAPALAASQRRNASTSAFSATGVRHLGAEPDALVEPHEMRRGVDVHGQACRFEHSAHEGDRGALAVGSGDMDDGGSRGGARHGGEKTLQSSERQVDQLGMQREGNAPESRQRAPSALPGSEPADIGRSAAGEGGRLAGPAGRCNIRRFEEGPAATRGALPAIRLPFRPAKAREGQTPPRGGRRRSLNEAGKRLSRRPMGPCAASSASGASPPSRWPFWRSWDLALPHSGAPAWPSRRATSPASISPASSPATRRRSSCSSASARAMPGR